MSGIAIGLAAVAVIGTGYSAIESSKAANTAASVDTATAAFNNKVDIEMAERQDANTYLSREAAGYASSGVLANTGSALKSQITNVGRLTQKIQQDYTNSQIQQQQYYTQGLEGVAAGSAQASADQSTANLDLIQGGAQIAGAVFGDYEKGVFSFGGTTPSQTTQAGGSATNGLF